jgi:OPA family glycerol-3-phosphate transporter-like MFS transporter 1/2
VNGPYSLITTAVSAELGTHESLRNSEKALATVTSVIDGFGSIGAAVGPLLAGFIGITNVFYMLITSDVLAFLVNAPLERYFLVKPIYLAISCVIMRPCSCGYFPGKC